MQSKIETVKWLIVKQCHFWFSYSKVNAQPNKRHVRAEDLWFRKWSV